MFHVTHKSKAAERPGQPSGASATPTPANPLWERLATSRTGPAAASLTVNAPDDPLEREADAVADRVMRTPAPPAGTPTPPPAGGGERPLDPPVKAEFETRFGRDFSGVRVNTGAAAADSARALGAQAFTVGQTIAFGRGAYAPHTPAGGNLLAHELAHTAQAERGDAAGRVQPRRVPAAAELDAAIPPAADRTGVMNARTGLSRVLSRAWASLDPAAQTTVRTAAAGFRVRFTNEATLRTALDSASRAQLLQFADEVRKADPALTLGDPLLIDTGARPGTADASNITGLVAHATIVFGVIASGALDADIGQVFGTANLAAARTRYANALSQMIALHATNKIVTDRSGYNAEVGLGGLSNSAQISVAPSVIDNPSDINSVITLIHESMHAGNRDVRDHGYIHQPSFTVLDEATKLKNAAHFEVVPRRFLSAPFAFAGQTFTPAGAGGTPALTPREEAIRDASETFRSAWTIGLNLHTLYVRLFRTPVEWTTLDLGMFSGAVAGTHFSQALPFWSKVQGLTMHAREAAINPAGAAAVRPVTLIDVALSEGVVRKLLLGMRGVPPTPAAADTFILAHATAAEKLAAVGAAGERDLLIKLVIRAVLGSITGGVDRDIRVVGMLAGANIGGFSEMLKVRPPSAFP